MSNYIYTNEGLVNADELMHYGVPGMRWGRKKSNPYAKRAVRGHAGAGRYITTKRQSAGDKRDLDILNKGQHLSVGLTKKRQAAYDAKDRARLEKRIAKNEKKLLQKEYGKLEDQLTYGKKADAKKNAAISKKMNDIEKKLNSMEKAQRAEKIKKGKTKVAGLFAGTIAGIGAQRLGFGTGVSAATAVVAQQNTKSRMKMYDELYNTGPLKKYRK